MIVRMIHVACDGVNELVSCLEQVEHSEWTVAEAKTAAKKAGFKRVEGRDLCPKCQALRRRCLARAVDPKTLTQANYDNWAALEKRQGE